jgi:hypothetical protein
MLFVGPNVLLEKKGTDVVLSMFIVAPPHCSE